MHFFKSATCPRAATLLVASALFFFLSLHLLLPRILAFKANFAVALVVFLSSSSISTLEPPSVYIRALENRAYGAT